MHKLKEKLMIFLEKIKNNKKLQILLISLLIIVILLVYMTYSFKESDDKTEENLQITASTTEEYVTELEGKLSSVLSKIEGVGKVSVAITVSSGFVYEYAYEETNKESLSSRSNSSSLVLIDNKPVIVSMSYPVVSGVLIVAEGGDNLKVKLDILSSIQTLIDVANENITILDGEF